MNKNQKVFVNIWLIVLVVILAGAVGYFSLVKKSEPIVQQPTQSFTLPTPSPTPVSSSIDFYEVTYQDFELQCLGMGGNREFIVRTQAEYQRLIDTSPDLHPNPFLLCVDYEFPVIDFSQKTLLGKTIMGGGCSSEIKKKVLINDSARKVVYSITVVFVGTCEKAIHNNNWILVPKIPEDYTVKIEIDSRSDL